MCWLVTIALLVGGADRTESKDAKDRAKLRALMEVNRKAFPKVTEITAEALQAKLNNESVVLVDVRPEAERSISVIPGAISAAEFEENPSKYQGSVVACYCTVVTAAAPTRKSGVSRGPRSSTLTAAFWRGVRLVANYRRRRASRPGESMSTVASGTSCQRRTSRCGELPLAGFSIPIL